MVHDVPDKDTSVIYLEKGLNVGDCVIVRTDPTDEWIQEMEMSWYWSTKYNYPVTFYRQIFEIDNTENTITIDIPTKYAMKSRDNSGIYMQPLNLYNVDFQDFFIGDKKYPLTIGPQVLAT